MDVLKYGGGAGMGSYVIVLRDGKLMPFTWRRVYKSFDNAEEIYLSIYENDEQISVIELEGEKTPEGLKFVGYDSRHGKTYYVNQILGKDEKDNKSIIVAEGSGSPNAYKSLSMVSKFLYEIDYDTIDYEYAKQHFYQFNPEFKPAGCSSVRCGNFYGRNFDWYYNNEVTFVVRTPHYAGRYSSIGVSGSVPGLTVDVVDNRKYTDDYKILPFYLLDAVNEKGLFCNINVVPYENNRTTITKPEVEEKERINALMLVRYVVDHFEDAYEAVQYIKDYMAIYMPKKLEAAKYQLHFMVGDKLSGKTYVVEFINNRVVYVENSCMTNFYLNGVEFLDGGKVYVPEDVKDGNLPTSLGITPHGSGLERWNIMIEGMPTADSKEGMRSLMNSLMYSQSYTKTENVWYSEFVGETKQFGNITVDTNPDDENFQAIVNKAREYWAQRDRETGIVWITAHSSVYDLESNTLYVVSQEETAPNYTEYTFTFSAPDCEEIAIDIAKEKSERIADVSRLDSVIESLIMDGGDVE